MSYAKLKSIELTNFMGYKNAKAVFDDKGILNFKGYNSSGKSAFLTACAVAMMDAYPQKQAKFIRHGEDYFRIVLSFEENVVIVRDKYATGQSLYELYKDGKVAFTTKVGNKLTKIEGVPQQIADFLGLIDTELGYLNYQIRRDPMWLVETKGSENYYTLNEVLKSEEIARANALLNSDRNNLGNEITTIEAELSTCQMQLDSFSTIGEDLLSSLYEREAYVQELLRKYDCLFSLCKILEEMELVKKIPEVSAISTTRLEHIENLSKAVNGIENVKIFKSKVGKLDVRKVNAISKIAELVNAISGEENTTVIPKVTPVNADKLPYLSRLQGTLKEYVEALREVQDLITESNVLEEERNELVEKAKKSGINFVVCDNCGTLMEVANG